jgi:hypothetical protein
MKLRFLIRDLLWLTALCAVLVAWSLHALSQSKIIENLKASQSNLRQELRDRELRSYGADSFIERNLNHTR